MRLTEKVENYTEPYERRKDISLWDIFTKLGQLEDIEEKLGFGLNELVQMLTNGIWEVGAVDSETMLPVSQGITHFYIYGIDLENRKLLVFHHILPYERSIERCDNVLFSTLDLNKYKKKCLSGWALTREELEK